LTISLSKSDPAWLDFSLSARSP